MQKYDLIFKFVEVSSDNNIHVALMTDEVKNINASYARTLLRNRTATDEQIANCFANMLIYQRKQIISVPINHGVLICILEIHKEDDTIRQNSAD